MNYQPLSDNAARQAIDASNLWAEYLRARVAAESYVGGMYWTREGAYEYLVKTLRENKQQRLGPRSPETENIFATFHARKTVADARLASLNDALDEAQRQNKAVRAGRTPEIVVRLLNILREAGLEKHFRVLGTHALYAYESAAGVRIATGALARQNVNLLWDSSQKVQFLVDLQRDAGSVLAVLQRANPSFQRRDDALKNDSAFNDKGLQVEFFRCDNEVDLWSVQARRAALLARSPLFSQPVISATGKLATLNTIDPRIFVSFKRWMAGLKDREPVKRRRDVMQADAVQGLMDTNMLASSISYPR
jgi:hypothetical protein